MNMNIKETDAYKNIMKHQDRKTATMENTFLGCGVQFSYWYVDDEDIHEHAGVADNMEIVIFKDMKNPKYTWILNAAVDIALSKTVKSGYTDVNTWLTDVVNIVWPLVKRVYWSPCHDAKTDVRNTISDMAKTKFEIEPAV